MVALQILQVSSLSIIPNRFYESLKLKTWMCELCTLCKSGHIYSTQMLPSASYYTLTISMLFSASPSTRYYTLTISMLFSASSSTRYYTLTISMLFSASPSTRYYTLTISMLFSASPSTRYYTLTITMHAIWFTIHKLLTPVDWSSSNGLIVE